ncbi:MAG TPA: GAF domain-containing sensor histidine kinase [Chloroflexota bacterium]|nr:GAF domain-containing sensor histidine kinase [Chloroflexota bacterium]
MIRAEPPGERASAGANAGGQSDESHALRRALAEAELLNSVAVAAAAEEDLTGILAAGLNYLRHLIAFTGGSIAIVEDDRQSLVIRAAVGPFAETALGQRLVAGRGRSWQVVETATPFLSNDLHAEGIAPTTPVRSYLAVPLLWRRRAIGLLEVDSTEPNAFLDDDVRLLQRVAAALTGPVQLARRTSAAQAAQAAAEAAVRARDVFLGVAAHELKTPVTSLRGYAQLILRRLARDGAVEPIRLRQAMETIDRQAEKLGRLMTQLLDVSRMDAGRFSLETRPTDVCHLVREAIEDLRPRAGQHPLNLTAPDGPLTAEVDAIRLEQVLVNLLDNALKFSPDGAPVDVSLRTDGDERFSITVADRGPGVPDDQRPHLYERFYQAQSDGYAGGMGLGLYLSRQIVERHGGSIHADFPDGGGSRFTITLSRRAAATAAPRPHA